MPPEMSLTKPGIRAPVVPFTAARPTRAAPFTVENWPPAYTVVLVTARAVACAPALAVKPATGAPVVGLIEAILRFVTPLTVLKEPAMYSLVPSGEASTALTPPPLKVGRNVVSIRPVLMLYAARNRWFTVVPPPEFCSDENVPAM